MHQDAKDILYTEEQLKARVAELGKEISKDYQNEVRCARRGIKGCYRILYRFSTRY